MITDQSNARWFKSSHSADANECVEVAFLDDSATTVGVRDSKDPSGPILTFSSQQWDRFLGSEVWRR
ncbi:DUF397 domain-containing protein [Nocardia sp. NPDC004151]|uniref:DUF397 domain-containing protein n=1 Tax=Nocardia sp. NPDC004151 TaxID=3364304 RepID=UPI00369CC25A